MIDDSSMIMQHLQSIWQKRSWQFLITGLALLLSWTWFSAAPSLASEGAALEQLNLARQHVDQQAQLRQAQASRVEVLQGARGDFEKRAIALNALDNNAQTQARQALAADIQLLADLATTAQSERNALQVYDAALMARTRDLGSQSEQLRADTWPIVEQLKLYPEPLGQRFDWQPPTSEFFQTHSISLTTGDLESSIESAIDVGRNTYAFVQLLELDQTYSQKLATYDQKLSQISSQSTSNVAAWRTGSAALFLGILAIICLTSITYLTQGQQLDYSLLTGISLVVIWWISPTVPLALLAATAIILMIAYRPWLAGILPIISIPMYYRPRVLGTLKFPVSETLIGLIIAGLIGHWLWKSWQAKQFIGPNIRLNWPLLSLAIAIIISSLISMQSPLLVAPQPAWRELRRSIIEPIVWAFIVVQLIQQRQLKVQHLHWTLIYASTWIAGDALMRALRGEQIWATGSIPRIIGLLPSSTAFGVFIGAGSACALAYSLHRQTTPATRAARMVVPILLIATALSFTRGAWLGLIACSATLLIMQHQWKHIASAAIMSTLAAALFIAQPQLAQRFLRLDEQTGSARQIIWASGWHVIQKAPITGAGLDQFAYLPAATYGIPQIRFLTISHPHNLWLDIWTQLGLLGMVSLSTWLIATAYRSWQQRQQIVQLAGAIVLLQLTLHGIVDQTLFSGDLWYLWWLGGISVWHTRQGATHERRVLDSANSHHTPATTA